MLGSPIEEETLLSVAQVVPGMLLFSVIYVQLTCFLWVIDCYLSLSLLFATSFVFFCHDVYSMNSSPDPGSLSPAEINELPVACFQAVAPADCAICITAFRGQEQVSCLPCDHQYHPSCIREWLSIRNSCPLCKTKVFPRIERDSSESVLLMNYML